MNPIRTELQDRIPERSWASQASHEARCCMSDARLVAVTEAAG